MELKSTDLRIGNLVGLNDSEWNGFNQFFDVMDSSNVKRFLEDKNKHASIISIGKEIELMAYGCDLDYYSIDEIEPIPLTEECLIKLGFKEYEKKYFIGINYGRYSVKRVGDVFNHWYLNHEFDATKRITSNIMYVHQLQNLYHALTGEELIIK